MIDSRDLIRIAYTTHFAIERFIVGDKSWRQFYITLCREYSQCTDRDSLQRLILAAIRCSADSGAMFVGENSYC